jgi:hypothetical protein
VRSNPTPPAPPNAFRYELGKPNTLLVVVGRLIKTKKKCCKSGPRCKRCPVVCKRLEKLGYVERQAKRDWTLVVIPPKSVLAAARAR